MMLTTDRTDPSLGKIRADGQQESYLVLSEEERAKGFVRPLRNSYRHLACGAVTTMGQALCETYARNPKFYSGTFCCNCGKHFDLGPANNPAFVWEPDGDPVGSNAEEAAAWEKQRKMLTIPALRRGREQRIEAAKRELDAALHSPEWDVCCCCECSDDYPCNLQDKSDDSVYCPKCRTKS